MIKLKDVYIHQVSQLCSFYVFFPFEQRVQTVVGGNSVPIQSIVNEGARSSTIELGLKLFKSRREKIANVFCSDRLYPSSYPLFSILQVEVHCTSQR